MSHTTSSISQHGITWGFDDENTFGQYATGDYWVKGTVTITTITPDSTTTGGRVKHGTMLNPSGGAQGYESHESDLGYDPVFNVDPGATGEDLVVSEGSVVSAVSKPDPDDNGRPLLRDLAVLTVVAEKPPDDAFRPDPYRDSKQHNWRESDLDESILRDLPVVGSTPDLDAAAAESLRFWNEQDTSRQQRAVQVENNQPVYGRDIAKRSGQMLLLLHLDIDPDYKRDLFVGLVQYGLDIPGGGASGIDVDGWVVGIRDGEGSSENDDGRVEVEFDTRSNVGRIAGETLIGQETGAEIQIPEDEDVANIERFVSPNKLLRIWGSGGHTISMAWGVGVVSLEDSVWYPAKPDPQEWNLLETVIDVEEGCIEAWVNFGKRVEFRFDPAAVETDNSPTMQLLGMHTGNFGFNTFRVSEVYQDRSVQRVVVADADTLAQSTHYELQRPTGWSAETVRFALTDGQLPMDEQLYVFVFDDWGQVNEPGYPITLPRGVSEG